MAEYMTLKEKMELLNSTPVENIHEIQERVEGAVVTEENGRIAVRVDLREYISRRMAEEGITQAELAVRVGKQRQNMNRFLRGLIPIPLDTLEEILWLLEENNIKK